MDTKYLDIQERKPHRMIILEGPDCAGKTTLARELKKRMANHLVVHHGPYARMTGAALPRLYLESMRPSLDRWYGLIMDRSWLSEQVYGPVYRNKNRIDRIRQRHLERIALRLGAVVVLCLPTWEKVSSEWLKRKGREEEMLDNESQLGLVYEAYKHLHTSLPIIHYDYTKHGSNLTALQNEIARVGTTVHKELTPTVGNWDARVVLVGEKPSDHTDADGLHQYPFCSFSKQGSSDWLTRQLIDAQVEERDLLWANMVDGLHWIKDIYARPVVALGQAASEKLAAMHIEHHQVPHPAHHQRFGSGEEYPLIPLLTNLLKK